MPNIEGKTGVWRRERKKYNTNRYLWQSAEVDCSLQDDVGNDIMLNALIFFLVL